MRPLRVLALLLLCTASSAFAQSPAASPSPALPFTLKLIGPNAWAAIDTEKGDAGANAGFLIGDDGVLVVDTFENEAAARALLAEIRRLTKQPVKFVVNTHYHVDHVAGNRVFAEAGAVIVAHRNLRGWINTENLKFYGAKITPEQKKSVENLLAPEVVYDSSLTLFLGTRRIEIKYFEGHTGGDSVVILPDAGIVYCGDLFWRKTLANLIDATTSAWITSESEIARLVPSPGIFVPGHGDVGNAQDVLDFQAYLSNLRAMVQKSASTGATGDALVSAVLPELQSIYGSWDFFKYFSRSNILDTAAELAGSKRVPPRGK